MHCASCKVEYRDGFSVCADCGARLLEGEPPSGSESGDESLRMVFETSDPALVPVVKSLLLDAGIEFVARGESVQALFSGGSLGRSAGPVQFFVAPEDAVDAGILLADLDDEDSDEGSEAHPWPSGDSDATFEEIVNLEVGGWEALAAGMEEGREFYSSVLHDDCVMLFPGGLLLQGRGEILDSLALQAWSGFEIDDAQSVWLAPGALTLIYRVTAQREGAGPYEALVSSTYVLTDDEWKLSVHQQTPV